MLERNAHICGFGGPSWRHEPFMLDAYLENNDFHKQIELSILHIAHSLIELHVDLYPDYPM